MVENLVEAVLTEDEANHKYMLSCFVCFFQVQAASWYKTFSPSVWKYQHVYGLLFTAASIGWMVHSINKHAVLLVDDMSPLWLKSHMYYMLWLDCFTLGLVFPVGECLLVIRYVCLSDEVIWTQVESFCCGFIYFQCNLPLNLFHCFISTDILNTNRNIVLQTRVKCYYF